MIHIYLTAIAQRNLKQIRFRNQRTSKNNQHGAQTITQTTQPSRPEALLTPSPSSVSYRWPPPYDRDHLASGGARRPPRPQVRHPGQRLPGPAAGGRRREGVGRLREGEAWGLISGLVGSVWYSLFSWGFKPRVKTVQDWVKFKIYFRFGPLSTELPLQPYAYYSSFSVSTSCETTPPTPCPSWAACSAGVAFGIARCWSASGGHCSGSHARRATATTTTRSTRWWVPVLGAAVRQ